MAGAPPEAEGTFDGGWSQLGGVSICAGEEHRGDDFAVELVGMEVRIHRDFL